MKRATVTRAVRQEPSARFAAQRGRIWRVFEYRRPVPVVGRFTT
jgi:hypothetical protein